MEASQPRKRILAVASGGGHWVQLLRLRPAFAGHHTAFVTVREEYRSEIGAETFYVINDATRWDKWGLVKMALRLAWIFAKERPQVVVSTGAAPGYFAIRLAKLLGARTIWLDSIANVEEMSMTGQMVAHHADLWLTQWEHLADGAGPGSPRHAGSVL